MVLEQVGEFVRDEVGRGRPASQDRYQEWAAREPARPTTRVLQRYGGLKALVKKAARAGALEKARREAEREANPTPEEQAEREAAKLQEIVGKEQCQQILGVIAERRIAGRREIEQALGWGQGTASNWLPHLCKAGLIICTSDNPRVANARYRLPGKWSADDQAAADRKHAEELLQHPNWQGDNEVPPGTRRSHLSGGRRGLRLESEHRESLAHAARRAGLPREREREGRWLGAGRGRHVVYRVGTQKPLAT